MAERAKMVQRVQDAQIKEIDELLTSEHAARRMKEPELARWGHKLAAWTTELTVGGRVFGIRIMLGVTFPFHPPEIFLEDTGYYLKFPHVEKTGKLCLTAASASFSPARPKDTVQYLIDQTVRLLADSAGGRNREDFILEFQSYWPGRLVPASTPFWSILKHRAETRVVYCWSGNNFTLFAETPAECREWVKNLGGGVAPKNMSIVPTVFAWSKEPVFPDDYPATGIAFRRLAGPSCADLNKIFVEVTPRDASALPVMFGFATSAGPVFAGMILNEPKIGDLGGAGTRNCKNDGYRRGKVPAEVLTGRYFGGASALGANVFRGDAAWIHERGGSGADTVLARKRVGVFGCGSIGADIAFLLAKSGVGGFYLVDNQVLSLDNVGRHLLGVDYVRRHKSDALETFLKKQLPALSIDSGGGRDIESILRETPRVFENLDLIISTTGDWPSDCTLNVAARQWPSFPPVIFGWTEAYGVAGHALLIDDHGGCLACGMSEHGCFERRVAEWKTPEKTLLRAAGCGDFYQPYAVTDVAPTKTMIAELALQCLRSQINRAELRTWVGDLSRLASLGGDLNGLWKDQFANGEEGRKVFRFEWERNPRCPFCN